VTCHNPEKRPFKPLSISSQLFWQNRFRLEPKKKRSRKPANIIPHSTYGAKKVPKNMKLSHVRAWVIFKKKTKFIIHNSKRKKEKSEKSEKEPKNILENTYLILF
jgi:hypothetical protein